MSTSLYRLAWLVGLWYALWKARIIPRWQLLAVTCLGVVISLAIVIGPWIVLSAWVAQNGPIITIR